MIRPLRVLRPLWRGLRIFSLWGLPPLVLALILAVAFAGWCVSSEPGSRWLLRTVVGQLGGEVSGVRGSILRGLSVAELDVTRPELTLHVSGLHFDARWGELRERKLHITDLSATRMALQVRSSPPAATQEPFRWPSLPVALQVDRLAVGKAAVEIDDQPLPVADLSLTAALEVNAAGATATLAHLGGTYDRAQLSLSGSAALKALAAPWPFEVQLQASGSSPGGPSALCLEPWLSGRAAAARGDCQVDLQLRAQGTAQHLQLHADASGQGLRLRADAEVLPDQAFPLGLTQLDLTLPGDAGLHVVVTPGSTAGAGARPVDVHLEARRLHLTPWLPAALGTTVLDLQADLSAGLATGNRLQDLTLGIELNRASRWNGEPASGHLRIAHLGRASGVLFDPEHPAAITGPGGLTVSGLDVQLALGPDRLEARGDFAAAAASKLVLQAHLPVLQALWPGLPGGGTLSVKGDGSLARQQATLQAEYAPDGGEAGVPGRAATSVQLGLEGGWTAGRGWQGRVDDLRLEHAGLALRSQGAVPVTIDDTGAWQVGQAALQVLLNGDPLVQLRHQASSGSAGRWASRGAIDQLVVTPERIRGIQAWLARAEPSVPAVRTPLSKAAANSRLEVRLDWNLRFDGALAGDIHLARTGGDLVIPGDVPITLGLQAAGLDLSFRPGRNRMSQLRADLQVRTVKMGSLHAQADLPVHGTAAGGIFLDPRDVKHVRVQADSEDLAWVNLFVDGALEVGGTLHADVRGQSGKGGGWTFSGPIRVEALHVLALDQGVRLLDGTLQAHLDGTRVVLDDLRFPAVRRVTPKEWRTATWVAEDPDAQNGRLDVSGDWDLAASQGAVGIAFRRYPILQRADRYAMVSGSVTISATLPAIRVNGKITVDAGWFDLDMLNNVPALDGDVVVLQPGKSVAPEPAPPPDLSVDLTLDLGPRFYLTGYGVNSGLVGSLDLKVREGKLTALGALHTRGGSIDVYGQHLQLRRGTVTFQGDIVNPVLSIEALRTGVAVQAGVRVSGTARRPRIGLVSHPDVSETEKLTWLLLGHGPDEGGGDMSLLFSVGSSFLSGGEPFYKRFGLDELSMRSGQLGAAGSVLPVETVVSDLDAGASPIEQRFVLAGKTLSDDVKVSLEQALAQTGTVARLSYRLARRLQAQIAVGTVSGLALVYRWFSMN